MCTWTTDEPGVEVECTLGNAAFGRCATQTKNGQSVGDCIDPTVYPYPGMAQGHSVMCCQAADMVDDDKCGWIYAKHGNTADCPGYTVAAGFCGTAAYDLCQINHTFGIRWCPSK